MEGVAMPRDMRVMWLMLLRPLFYGEIYLVL